MCSIFIQPFDWLLSQEEASLYFSLSYCFHIWLLIRLYNLPSSSLRVLAKQWMYFYEDYLISFVFFSSAFLLCSKLKPTVKRHFHNDLHCMEVELNAILLCDDTMSILFKSQFFIPSWCYFSLVLSLFAWFHSSDRIFFIPIKLISLLSNGLDIGEVHSFRKNGKTNR